MLGPLYRHKANKRWPLNAMVPLYRHKANKRWLLNAMVPLYRHKANKRWPLNAMVKEMTNAVTERILSYKPAANLWLFIQKHMQRMKQGEQPGTGISLSYIMLLSTTTTHTLIIHTHVHTHTHIHTDTHTRTHTRTCTHTHMHTHTRTHTRTHGTHNYAHTHTHTHIHTHIDEVEEEKPAVQSNEELELQQNRESSSELREPMLEEPL